MKPKERKIKRIRKKIAGNAERPRLAIFKSNTSMYTQVINDETSSTICNAFVRNKKNIEAAKLLGAEIAKNALSHSIKSLVFDRRGYKYHGVIKAFVDSVRENGITI